ncbi:MAG: hypothetical protein ACOCVR_02415 [Myxococcota bacterium]
MLRKLTVGLGILALAAPASVLQAATVLGLTVDELAEQSERVVRARVVSREAEIDDSVGLVFTYTTLEVLEDLAGEGPSRIVLRQLGGEAEGMGIAVEGDARFEVGEEVVVFVRSGDASGRLVHLEALSLGKFRIERPEGLPAMAVREMEGLRLVRDGEIETELPAQITLEELQIQVRRSLPVPPTEGVE